MRMFDLTYREPAYDHATRLTDSTYVAIETSCVDVASQRLDLCTGYKISREMPMIMCYTRATGSLSPLCHVVDMAFEPRNDWDQVVSHHSLEVVKLLKG